MIAIGVMYNGARISLSGRGRELASLRVMGFRRREASILLIGEQAIITGWAFPVGWLFGYALSRAISTAIQTDTYRLPFVVEPAAFVCSALATIVAAVINGALVRRRINRLDLIEVLKTRE